MRTILGTRNVCGLSIAALLLLGGGCGEPGAEPAEEYNPFLEDMSNPGKSDTGYYATHSVEVEVDVEADVEAGTSYIYDAPAELGQYAATYLKKKGTLFLESIAEDASNPGRVEWLVDGKWLLKDQLDPSATASLRRFRIRGLNAVVLGFSAISDLKVGQLFEATVPVRPYQTDHEGGASCVDELSDISRSQSVYWYLWNPEKQGCTVEKQKMSITVSKLFQSGAAPYPEYDQLIADKKVSVVIMYGKISDTLDQHDPGMQNFEKMTSRLWAAGFRQAESAPVGRRMQKTISGVEVIVDLYSPRDFGGLGDVTNFHNFQKAISEHEVVMYDGHSMLGGSDFWSRPKYPSFYQIFVYGGCLGYQYYVKKIMEGKGGWDKVDIVSSVVEVPAASKYASTFLAKFFWGLENNYAASWKNIMIAVRSAENEATFGVSGVRDNCFSPSGSLCLSADPEHELTVEKTPGTEIPDNDVSGLQDDLEVKDSFVSPEIMVELDLTHRMLGDLIITIQHNGAEETILNKASLGGPNLNQRFVIKSDALRTQNISGTWTLKVADVVAADVGVLNRWALHFKKP